LPQLGGLDVRQVILHEVPRARRHDDNPPPVVLSDVPAPLNDQNRGFIQERLRGALKRAGMPIVSDPTSSSLVPDIIRSYFSPTARDLVPASKELASRLRAVQTGVNSGGLLMVVDALLDGEDAMVIAKLEHERGVRAAPKGEAGSRTFSVDYIRDLLLTDAGRVYKVGLFTAAAARSERLAGWCIDRQVAGADIAGFFLTEYLGCQLAIRPEQSTREFYEQSQNYINSRIADAELKARYEIALLAELNSPRNEITLDRFAAENLDADHRDEFVETLSQRGVPRTAFPKATELIRHRIRRVQIETARDVLVAAPPDAMRDGTVTVTGDPHAPGEVELTVRDRVVRVRGGGRAAGAPPADARQRHEE